MRINSIFTITKTSFYSEKTFTHSCTVSLSCSFHHSINGSVLEPSHTTHQYSQFTGLLHPGHSTNNLCPSGRLGAFSGGGGGICIWPCQFQSAPTRVDEHAYFALRTCSSSCCIGIIQPSLEYRQVFDVAVLNAVGA
jgi:hypothetical protein